MEPSESTVPVVSNVADRPVVDALNAAVGKELVAGVPSPSPSTRKLGNRTAVEVVVPVGRCTAMPTPPAACSAAVVSVRVSCGAGSAPVVQTAAETVVVPAPAPRQ